MQRARMAGWLDSDVVDLQFESLQNLDLSTTIHSPFVDITYIPRCSSCRALVRASVQPYDNYR